MASLTGNLFVVTINHLISQESWASSRLAPFSGQWVKLVIPPFQLVLVIRPDGQFENADSVLQTPSVSIVLPEDTPAKFIIGDFPGVFSMAKISGSADFAEALAFVFRNLRWDAESDIARVIGDVAAVRSVQIAREFFSWQKSAAFNFAQNLKEYLTEESGSIVTERELGEFSRQTKSLRDDLARLEKRIAKF